MTGEEMTGPAGPKILRLVCFVGAGFICSAAINKWRELERKSLQKKQQEINLSTDNSENAAVMKLEVVGGGSGAGGVGDVSGSGVATA